MENNGYKAPAFQFYPKDFLTDDKVLAMSDDILGKYIKLLCIDWLNDGLSKNDFNAFAGLKEGSSGARVLLERCFDQHPRS